MKIRFPQIAAILLAATFVFAPMSDALSPVAVTAQAATSSTAPKSSKYTHKTIIEHIDKYAKDNSDVRGWLLVPNTNISKAIPYNKTSNKYYIYRDIKGVDHPGTNYKNFPETAIYLDYRTKFADSWSQSSRNTVLYGHNWTNLRAPLDIGKNNKHTMFGQLPSYTNLEFAQSTPHIYFSTKENEGIWRVFCVAYVEVDKSFNYNAPNPSKAEYGALLQELKDRSMFDFDVDVKDTDRILTLSTCTRAYNDAGSSQRFIVVARLLRNGESEKDAVTVTVNKDMKQPKLK